MSMMVTVSFPLYQIHLDGSVSSFFKRVTFPNTTKLLKMIKLEFTVIGRLNNREGLNSSATSLVEHLEVTLSSSVNFLLFVDDHVQNVVIRSFEFVQYFSSDSIDFKNYSSLSSTEQTFFIELDNTVDLD